MPHDKNGREFHEGDWVDVRYHVIASSPELLFRGVISEPAPEGVTLDVWLPAKYAVKVEPPIVPPEAETARVLRVLTHHDQLALAQTAGFAGSIPNLVSLAIRQAMRDVREGKDYPTGG